MGEPEVKVNDIIEIGSINSLGFSKLNAIVCDTFEDSLHDTREFIEAIYFPRNKGSQAYKDYFVWKDSCWEFKIEGPSGLRVDHNKKYSSFVQSLKSHLNRYRC